MPTSQVFWKVPSDRGGETHEHCGALGTGESGTVMEDIDDRTGILRFRHQRYWQQYQNSEEVYGIIYKYNVHSVGGDCRQRVGGRPPEGWRWRDS